MTDSQQSEQRSDSSDVPLAGVIGMGIVLVLAWPLLLRGRGAPFEGFHRRELVVIGAGMLLWGAIGWAVGFPEVLTR